MPSNLQGLNIVHPAQIHSDSRDLLSGQPYPDIAAQLDLWTNLAFESDDGSDDKYRRKATTEEEDDYGSPSGEPAIHDGHVNIVTGTNISPNLGAQLPPHPAPAFDLNTFLAGFGIDPFAVLPTQSEPQPTGIAPSLSQLLALHSAAAAAPSLPTPSSSAAGSASSRRSADDAQPTKRTRTRKTSISTVDSPESYREETPNPSGSPISAAEDKRRRNTAASARFRLKKKEREAALEGKAKELEGRVHELERECEGLRRENGWLKGLVVGVTGAAQGPAAVTAGAKRPRDETEHA